MRNTKAKIPTLKARNVLDPGSKLNIISLSEPRLTKTSAFKIWILTFLCHTVLSLRTRNTAPNVHFSPHSIFPFPVRHLNRDPIKKLGTTLLNPSPTINNLL